MRLLLQGRRVRIGVVDQVPIPQPMEIGLAIEELREDIVATLVIRDHVERVMEVRDMVFDNLAERYGVSRFRLENRDPSFPRLPFRYV